MHLDIASADVLATPQETYFKSQVSQHIPIDSQRALLATQQLYDPFTVKQ